MIELAKRAAKEAGTYLLGSLGKALHIEKKEGQETNIVTQIDKGAEEIIIGMIRKEHPDHSFLAEESGGDKQVSDYLWVIDPLDGTVNFAHGMRLFSVSIALLYRGNIVLGVVYDPCADELFSAERGKGAFLDGKPLHVSKADRLIDSLLVTGFPYAIKENPNNAVEHFVNFLYEARGIRRLGSAAIDLAYVAAGRLDAFWEVWLHPWDQAAGILLVEEAGGKVSNFTGDPMTIYNKDILATNTLIHDQMIEVLKRGTNQRVTIVGK